MAKNYQYKAVWTGVCCLLFSIIFSPTALWAAGEDDELIVLPGENKGATQARKRTQAKAEYKKDTSLPPIYGPPKEWQSFRSTAQITCAVRIGTALWAGTHSGLIRWDLRGGGYRFYVPKINRADARHILGIAASPEGDLWMATEYGVAWLRQGESQWKFFRKKDGLPDNHVQAVAWIKGALWVGTRKGVARWHKRRWKRWTTAQGLPASDIRAIGADEQGRIWFSPNIATPFYRQGERFVPVKNFPVVGATCVVGDTEGGVWFCSDQGAIHYKNDQPRVFSVDHGLAGINVQSILVDAGGGVWMGTRQKGISYYKSGRWVTMDRRHGLPGVNIKAILPAPGGQLLAATHLSGLAMYVAGRWQRMAVGIVGNKIQAIAYAPDGAVWVGTASGVSRYFQGYWYNLTLILPHPDVRAIAFDPAGRVWIGTYGGGVVQYDGQNWKTFDVMNGLASNKIVGAGLTPEGLWFAHEHKGVTQFDGKDWKVHRGSNTGGVLSPKYPIHRMYVDKDFRLWIASRGDGLIVRQPNGSWSKVPGLRSGTQQGVVYDVASDASSRVWIATKAGLFRYENGQLKHFTRNEGLPHQHVLAVSTEGDKVWVGTPEGVGCLDGLAWRTFTRDAGLAANQVSLITVTPWGEKWFGSILDGLTIYRGQ